MGDISGETISIIIAILVATSGSMALTLALYIRLDRRFDALERRFDAFERGLDAAGEVKGILEISRTSREREPLETAA